MSRKKLALAIGSVVGLLAAAAMLVWHLWPEPPPTTADMVYGAVMAETDPLKMSPEELDRWVNDVASVVERLPPHEMQKLLTLALQNETIRQRFESLEPATRQRLVSLISQEQRARLGAEMAQGMVAFLKAMPRPVRNAAIRQMHEHGKRERGRRGGRGGHPEMTKERFAEWQAASSPRQRSKFIRAMRDMRKMLEDAGIEH